MKFVFFVILFMNAYALAQDDHYSGGRNGPRMVGWGFDGPGHGPHKEHNYIDDSDIAEALRAKKDADEILNEVKQYQADFKAGRYRAQVEEWNSKKGDSSLETLHLMWMASVDRYLAAHEVFHLRVDSIHWRSTRAAQENHPVLREIRKGTIEGAQEFWKFLESGLIPPRFTFHILHFRAMQFVRPETKVSIPNYEAHYQNFLNLSTHRRSAKVCEAVILGERTLFSKKPGESL